MALDAFELFERKLFAIPVTIGSGGSISPALDLNGLAICGFYLPGDLDAAVALTFQAQATENTNPRDLYRAGAEYSITVGADQFVVVDPAVLAGVPYILVRLGTSASPITASADRTIHLVVRAV